ncbi:site-specific integrase [Dietzia sp. oral taxon 368]|uniref:site-specific integrase n=1 Tax=Dietzia sp. oral taxon 368 TaxID=712270 RepID=UPI000D086F2B|nr:tyrosine-type recombinase/integrase [Dietzia sp. oral taxon 368]AVM65401.1 site-specific integrase [Dietzia sp. oral taxon 368]
MARKTDTERARFGSVRRLPSGRYQARYTGPDLARYTGPRTFQTKGDAFGWLRAEERLIELEVWTSPVDRERAEEAKAARVTVEAYGTAWMDQRDVRPKTLAEYRRFWASRVVPYIGQEAVAELTPARIRTWWAEIRKAHDTPTANARAYSLLKTVLSDAVTDGHLAANPCQVKGAGIAPKGREMALLTPAQLSAIAAAMPERYRAAVLVAAWGGLRFGELTELRRKDVAAGGTLVRVRRAVVRVDGEEIVGTPKSAEGVRDVHLPAPAAKALAAHLETFTGPGADALVFDTAAGGRVTPTRLREPFQRAVAKAGVTDPVRLHDLRHMGATMAAQAGATTKELMARLGHSTPTMAMRYQHAAAGRDAALAKRMAALADE